MGLWDTPPPQGFTKEQGLSIIGRSPSMIFSPPQGIGDGSISPGVDTELVEEVAGVFDALLYDDGVNTGFVLVQEF